MSSKRTRDYDSTVARIAGNLASGYVLRPEGTLNPDDIAAWSVRVARAIIEETKHTEPAPASQETEAAR